MKSISHTLWYAVNGTGQGCIFTDMPERDDHWKRWVGDMESCLSMVVSRFEANGLELPALTWKDEPVVIEISVSVKTS